MIRVENTVLPVVALSHPGMKGKNNEDRYGVTAFRSSANGAQPVLLAILSDGIGGHRAGEVASQMAVEIISQNVASSDGKDPPRILQAAIHQASQAINEQAQTNTEQLGMGATCACVWIAGDHLYTATVGDSRIYLMRGNTIQQLSTDHTWIQEALERGLIQPDQVNGHPNAHVIRRYLGSPALPEVDFRLHLKENESDAQAVTNQGVRLLPGDKLLLCSDGLTDLVKNDEILGAFMNMPQEETTKYLIDLANERGGHDNITLVSVFVPVVKARSVAAGHPLKSSLARSLVVGCLAVILLGVLAGSVLGGWIFTLLPPISTQTPTLTATLPLQATLPSSSPETPVLTFTLTPIQTVTPSSTVTNTPPTTSLATITPVKVNTSTPPLPVVTVNK